MRSGTWRLRPIRHIAIVLMTAACALPPMSPTGEKSETTSSPAARPSDTTSSPAARPSATTAGTLGADRDAWLVVGRPGESDLRVTLASSGEEAYTLPLGIPDATWGNVRTVTPGETTTRVQDLVVQPGLDAWRSLDLDGLWRMPTIGLDPLPGGVSSDGSTMVLVPASEEADRVDPDHSRFAIVDGSLTGEARIVELDGDFDYDALSPDGSILYVAEHVPGPLAGRYQVRAVDTATGAMRDAIIVDKRNLDAQMAGWPVDQAQRADGVVLTLYRGADYPFIHALHSREAWAVCIALPPAGMDDEAVMADWGVVSTDRGDVAVNATVGVAVAIAPDLTVRATVDFEPVAAGGIRLAKFGHTEAGPVGRRVIADPDGSLIYAAGAGGIVQLATDDLAVTGRFLDGSAIDALALTPDGRTLYALLRADGRIAAIDTATGDILGWAAGAGYDRLVGIAPW